MLSSAITLPIEIVTYSELMFDMRIGTTVDVKLTTTRKTTRGCISSFLLGSRSSI